MMTRLDDLICRHLLPWAVAATVAGCGSSPTAVEQPDVDPSLAGPSVAEPAPEDPATPPVTPRDVPEGADATGVTDPPGEGEDATPVLDEEHDQDGVTHPTPEH